MPRTVLETLVVRVIGEFNSYRRMMHAVPRMARVAAAQTQAAFSKLDKGVIGFAKRLDSVGTRAIRRFQVTVGRSFQNIQANLKKTRASFFSGARRGGMLIDALFGVGGIAAFRRTVGQFQRGGSFRQLGKNFLGLAGAAGMNMFGKAGAFGSKGFRGLDAFLGGIAARVNTFGTRLQRQFQLLPRKIGRWAPMAAMAGLGMARRAGRMAVGGGMMAASGVMAGARALPGLARTGLKGAGSMAMGGLRAMPGMMGNMVGAAGAAMAMAARRAGPILRGMMGVLGRGAANTFGLLASAVTGRFIPAIIGAGAATSLWYSRFRNQIRKLGYDLAYLGRRISLYVTAPLLAVGVFAGVQFAKFDDAITTSMALLENVGPGTRKAMEQAAFNISAQSRTGPTDLAHAYFHLASAGFEATEAIGALAVVEKFAIAGAFDLNESGHSAGNALFAMGRATTYLIDSQSALGLRTNDTAQNLKNMTHVSDVLTKANMIANATVEDFAKSLTNKGAAALRIANKSMEEGVAVLAAYAMQGVKAETAGEKLYIVLRDLQRAEIKKPGAFKRLGINVFDDAENMRPIVSIIEDIERAFAGMTDRQKRATFMQLGFQDRSVAATMQLIGMSHHIREFDAALQDVGGTTEMVANRRLKSFTSQVMMTWNQLRIAAIGIGKMLEPAMLSFNETIRNGLKVWNSLDATTQKWIVKFGMLVAVIGPLLVALGVFATMMSTVFSGLLLVKVLMLAWAPFVLTVLAVAAAVALVAWSIVGTDGMVYAWKMAIQWIGNFVTQAAGFMENFSANMVILWNWFRSNWKTILDDVIRMIVVFASNWIMNTDLACRTFIRMFTVVLAWLVGQWERSFDTEFMRWASIGMVNVMMKFAIWSHKMERLLASIWTGEEVETGSLIETLTKDIERAATAQTFKQLMDQLTEIYQEGMAKMRGPLQGMEFTTPAGPKFITDVPKELEDNVINPVKALATTFGDLHDELDEDFNAHFTVSGIEAVQAGTVEAMARLLEYRQLKAPTAIEAAIIPPAAAAENAEVARVRALGEKLGKGPPGANGFGGGPTIPIAGGGDPFSFNSKGIRSDAVEEILRNIDANIEEQREFIEKNPNPFMQFGVTSIGAKT